jgi:hypothetical protein
VDVVGDGEERWEEGGKEDGRRTGGSTLILMQLMFVAKGSRYTKVKLLIQLDCKRAFENSQHT